MGQIYCESEHFIQHEIKMYSQVNKIYFAQGDKIQFIFILSLWNIFIFLDKHIKVSKHKIKHPVYSKYT